VLAEARFGILWRRFKRIGALATVIIVDDQFQRGNTLDSVLDTNGYESSLVPSMDAALDEMREKWPDVVLLADNLMDWSGQSRGYYRIIYPCLYGSQLSEADGLFFLKLGRFLEAKHVVAVSFSSN